MRKLVLGFILLATSTAVASQHHAHPYAAGHLCTGFVEKNDMTKAMNEYHAAMKLFPANLEMQYWTAITLVNNKQLFKALPMLKNIFSRDKNWKELTRRLPPVGLLTVSAEDLQKILAL